MNLTAEKIKQISIADYTYELPDEKIAKYPLDLRDQSKLLVYENSTITEQTFSDLHTQLNPGSLLVFNNTKVIRARLFFKKETGAAIEIFCLEPALPADYERAFKQTKQCEWFCIVGNLKRWKNEKLRLSVTTEQYQVNLYAEKLELSDDSVRIRFTWHEPIGFGELLEAAGNIPIPPYLNRAPEASDLQRYQTVYSKTEGSVAAPTAGLHFTTQVFESLRDNGFKTAELTLHVGAGTFKPVKSETIANHTMHTEHYFISKNLLQAVLTHFPNIAAVGTTTVRTLESMYWAGVKVVTNLVKSDIDLEIKQWDVYELPQTISFTDAYTALSLYLENKNQSVLPSSTQIIIAPGYQFRVINQLITNFHQPQSTLLLLIAAFIGSDWRKIYDFALENNVRFLSYGDSSLLKINHIDT